MVLSLGKQKKGKMKPESGPAPKKTSMRWSNYMGPKQLIVFMFKKEKKILFAYSFDVRIYAVIPSTTRMDNSHQHWAQRRNHTPTTSHGRICVADHCADQSERNEYSTAGEL